MKKILLCFIIPTITVLQASAQEELAPINTGAVNFLLLTTNAQSAAMGGASVALPGNNDAIFSNAATSVISPKAGGVVYTLAPVMRNFESEHYLNSIGGFYKIDKRNVILAGFRYYSYPKIEGIEGFGDGVMSFRPKEWAIDLGYAREIIPNLGVSATVRFVHSDMGSFGGAKSANAVAFDIGAVYQKEFQFMDKASWTAGIQVSNLGTKVKYLNTQESLPAMVKAGGSADVTFCAAHRLLVTAELQGRLMPADVQSVGVSAGAEYTFIKHFSARGGYHYGDKTKGDTSYATAGLGVSFYGTQLGFAWLFAKKDSPLRNSMWMSLGCTF